MARAQKPAVTSTCSVVDEESYAIFVKDGTSADQPQNQIPRDHIATSSRHAEKGICVEPRTKNNKHEIVSTSAKKQAARPSRFN